MKVDDPQILLCTCSSSEHVVIFHAEDDDEGVHNEVYLSIHLAKKPFFIRLWFALKYVFGYKCRYGNFEEIILSGDKHAEKLAEMSSYLKKR